MSALRPFPHNPSLEYERRQAKALLRQLHAAAPDALSRAHARHPRLDTSAPERIRLADAQLVIAREYGFASWPRLVRYFGDVDRQRHHHGSVLTREHYDGKVQAMLASHRTRRVGAGRALAAFVPRFYGMPLEQVFAAGITQEDARLAVARLDGFPAWEALLEHTAAELGRQSADGEQGTMRQVSDAMKAGDLEGLQRVATAHPELLHPTDYDRSIGRTLLGMALAHERRRGAEAMGPIIAWLVAQGLDLQEELNRQLCGRRLRMSPADVHWLLARGADPNWVAPNGIPVLEHALVRYWNGEAVDVLAAGAAPRKALWIAAGLGDLHGVRRSLDVHGNPKPMARRLRPDFVAVFGGGFMPQHPDPDDEEILMEAFVVAMVNGRTAILEYMVSRGTPVNSLIYGSPVINFAVGNAMVPVVECLVRCGADLDLPGWHPARSAREIARELFEEGPEVAGRRRIVELCQLDPEEILADRRSKGD